MRFKKTIATLCIFCFLSVQFLSACTGVIVKTQDGTIIAARTMEFEFEFDVRSNLLVIPKGTNLKFLSSVDGKDGYTMTTKYGFAGINAVEKQIVIDGVNQKGLYLGSFYFLGFAVYDKLTANN